MTRISQWALALSMPGGWRARRLGVNPTQLAHYRARFRAHGVRATDLLYVGANEGQELALLDAALDGPRSWCFEPQASAFDGLQRTCAAVAPGRSRAVHSAVGSTVGTVTLNENTTRSQLSSLRLPNESLVDHFGGGDQWVPIEVPITTLDAWRVGQGLSDRVLLKLDVQGAELDVLEGARETLRDVVGVIIETGLTSQYEGASPLVELAARLGEAGLRYGGELQVVRSHRTSEVVEFDALFFRPQPPNGDRRTN